MLLWIKGQLFDSGVCPVDESTSMWMWLLFWTQLQFGIPHLPANEEPALRLLLWLSMKNQFVMTPHLENDDTMVRWLWLWTKEQLGFAPAIPVDESSTWLWLWVWTKQQLFGICPP
jgi:hypothetical protein